MNDMPNEEPSENISGETAVDEGPWSEPDETSSLAQRIVYRLGALYWRKSYGDRPAFECLVRTVLSQNTSDKASQPAYDALIDHFGTDALAHALQQADRGDISSLIEPAGLYNQKATVLQHLAERIINEFGSAERFDDFVTSAPPEETRELLLNLDGVGPKTADCVLLFAGGADGVFPVDTHVHRVARRLGIAPADADHETVREHLEADLDPDTCGFGHTSMIQFGREYCTARRPACLEGNDHCPLSNDCAQVGVDPESGTVVDPADGAPVE